jgi:hypothetical protein
MNLEENHHEQVAYSKGPLGRLTMKMTLQIRLLQSGYPAILRVAIPTTSTIVRGKICP